MAIKIGEVFTDIVAKVGKFIGPVKKAQRSITRFEKNIRSFAKQNSIALTAFGAAGVLAFRNVITAAGDFEASMKRVVAVSGATGEAIESLTDIAKELGSTTQFSASEAASGMEFLAKAGFDTNEILQAIPQTLQLAAAAALDLGTAADIVSNVLTGFNLETAELARVNDVLVKAFTSSNTDLQQLGQAMKFAGPVAAAMNQNFEEVVAVLGALGNAGLQASLAGTAVRGALTRLANPAKEVSRVMKDLGLNVTDSEGNMISLIDIVEQLETSGASAAQIMKIFGQRAGPAMSALIAQGSQSLRDFTKDLENSGGTAARIAAVQMEGFNGAVKELTSALEGLKIAIGESGLLEFGTKAAKALARVIRDLGGVGKAVLGFGAAMAAVFTVGAPALAAWPFLVKGVVAAKVSLIALKATLLALNPILVGTALVITGLAAAYLTLASRTEDADKAQQKFAESQKTLAERQKEGFAVAKRFENVTAAQALKMGTAAEVSEDLSKGIRGLALSLGLAQDANAKLRIKDRIVTMSALRDTIDEVAAAERKARDVASAASIEKSKQDSEALANKQLTNSKEQELEEFLAERKRELRQLEIDDLVEAELRKQIITAEGVEARRIAEENLRIFNEERNLESFNNQKLLADQVSGSITNAFANSVVEIAKGQKKLSEIFKQAGASILQTTLATITKILVAERAAALVKIAIAKAVGAAKSIQAHAGIPFVGLALGIAAAAAITAAIVGLSGGFQKGGEVAGPPGTDNLLARLSPGEAVLTPNINDSLKSFLSAVSGRGGLAAAGAGGGMISIGSIGVEINNPIVDSDERLDEMADAVGERFLDKLKLDGRIPNV